MTRREFSVSLAGLVALPSFGVTLHAIAGARLPATLTIGIPLPDDKLEALWELRTYRISESRPAALAEEFASIFPRAGIHPLLVTANGPNLTYLIPFGDLTARDRAWTSVNADPKWADARPRFQSYQFGLYRVA
jgi:NIPSNAP